MVRMIKDFGDNALPLMQGGFLPGDRYPGRAVATWRGMLFQNRDLLHGLQGTGMPGFVSGVGPPEGANDVALLYIPDSSIFSQDWTEGMRVSSSTIGEVLTATNATVPLVQGHHDDTLNGTGVS